MATFRTFPDKPQFSGHETFPLRQLWLRKAYFAVAESEGAASKVFTEDAAIRRFGVGKNMVAAIRHWALACAILEEETAGVPKTSFIGDLLFGIEGLDPYLERPATCWLIHWMLAGRASRSTTWYWIFNCVPSQTFQREHVVTALQSFAAHRRLRASAITLKRDVEVCLRCYLPRSNAREQEDAAEPLLSDLGLITEGPSGTFQFRRGPQPTLPDSIFAFALLEFWNRWESSTMSSQNTLAFEAIAHDPGSPGRVFKLDESSVAERLMNLESVTLGTLRWTDSAGLRQVSRTHRWVDDHTIKSLLRRAYGR